jgi:SAM-dependent methyltransferase
VVELGTHRAVSYMAFCQAARRLATPPRCHAVDTWQGDEHAGSYGNEVFEAVSALNAARYAEFSTLLRMRFAEALDRFEDGSIDILHIDGFHTYDAVAEDFRTWLPKMSSRGVVLFHDTEVRERDFGVWKLWADLTARYPSFSFLHGYGLGVLGTGPDQPAALRDLFAAGRDPERAARLRDLFARRGAAVAAQRRDMAAPPAPRAPDGTRPADAQRPPREVSLLAGATPGARILEIGPSHAPVAPRSAGWDTTVVDHADRAGLVAKYGKDPNVDTSRIEEVDIVWSDGPLDAAIPAERHGTYDVLVASHVIEHFPDPVGVLRAAGRLLRPDGGTVSLAVPDKRYCFDFFRPPTTTGKLLGAHRDSRARHTAADIFDNHAYLSELDGVTGWGFEPSGGARPRKPLRVAWERFQAAREEPGAPYEDCHAWVFTPASFELAILELAELGVIDWRVERTLPQPGVEFIVHLKRGRRLFASEAAFEAHRLELLGDAMRDLHAQTLAFLGPARGEEPMTAAAPELPAADDAALPEPVAPEPPPGPFRALVRLVVPMAVRVRIARLRGRAG